ncbi:Hypothetical predicted protein [Mytilus galloprovincialis]|uniref:Uncharacterized protein n=1 Tax=Mytilus galloprovincialis TaxID=29158 RepID=A0A8B6FZL5_MYTGA|nr:Hypothetical predicted protein [Mytilus galloprovincialis]
MIYSKQTHIYSSSQLFSSLSLGMSAIQREPPLPFSALSPPETKPSELQLMHGHVPMAPPLPCSPPITLPMPPIQPPTPQFTWLEDLYRRPLDQQPPTQPQLSIEAQLQLAMAVPFTNFEKMTKDEELKCILSLHRSGFWRPSGTIVDILCLSNGEELRNSKYKDNVWCSALVIKYVRQELSDFQEEWIRVENNAMKWLLSQLCEGQSLEMLLEEAVYPTEYEWPD